MGTPIRTTPDAAMVLGLALIGAPLESDDAYLSGASRLAFTLFYENSGAMLHDLRGYADLKSQVLPDERYRSFYASMRAGGYASQIILLHSWDVTPKIATRHYRIYLSRSPRTLLLVVGSQLMLETDKPHELFGAIDQLMSGVDTSKLSYEERRRLDVASRMMDRLQIMLKDSTRIKRESAERDERAANMLGDTLRRLGVNYGD